MSEQDAAIIRLYNGVLVICGNFVYTMRHISPKSTNKSFEKHIPLTATLVGLRIQNMRHYYAAQLSEFAFRYCSVWLRAIISPR